MSCCTHTPTGERCSWSVDHDGRFTLAGDPLESVVVGYDADDRPVLGVARRPTLRPMLADRQLARAFHTTRRALRLWTFHTFARCSRALEATMTYSAPFTTRGSVRGSCSHKHRTWEAAARCCAQDDRDCGGDWRRRPGFGSYSDRRVFDATGTVVRYFTDDDGRFLLLDEDGLP